jgi:Lecithin retinol acyltransferase
LKFFQEASSPLVVHYYKTEQERVSRLKKSTVNTCSVREFVDVSGCDFIWSQSHKPQKRRALLRRKRLISQRNDQIYCRTEEMIGKTSYNVFLENCQHLAYYIATGNSMATGVLNCSGQLCLSVLTYYPPFLCALDLLQVGSLVSKRPITALLSSGDLYYWIFGAAYFSDTAFEVCFRSGMDGRRHAGRQFLMLTVVLVGLILVTLVWFFTTYHGMPSAVIMDCAIVLNVFSFSLAWSYNLPLYARQLQGKGRRRSSWKENISWDLFSKKERILLLIKPYSFMLLILSFANYVGTLGNW